MAEFIRNQASLLNSVLGHDTNSDCTHLPSSETHDRDLRFSPIKSDPLLLALDKIFYHHYQNMFNMLSKTAPSIPFERQPPVPNAGPPYLKLPIVSAELSTLQQRAPALDAQFTLTPLPSAPTCYQVDQPTESDSTDYASTVLFSSTSSLNLRQRGRTKTYSPWGNRVRCRLCQNQIMTNRLANLQNHARRHSKLKQFHCPYCQYAHTEVAKVRLHMDHNHSSEMVAAKREPLDLRNEKIEESWALMMRLCFPDYARF